MSSFERAVFISWSHEISGAIHSGCVWEKAAGIDWRHRFPIAALDHGLSQLIARGLESAEAITFALLVTVWGGIIAWLIAPARNWRMFKVALLALPCLILAWLASLADPPPHTLLIFGCAAVLICVAAARIRPPTAEDIRLECIATERTGDGHVSWWIKLLAWVVIAIPVYIILMSLYKMFR